MRRTIGEVKVTGAEAQLHGVDEAIHQALGVMSPFLRQGRTMVVVPDLPRTGDTVKFTLEEEIAPDETDGCAEEPDAMETEVRAYPAPVYRRIDLIMPQLKGGQLFCIGDEVYALDTDNARVPRLKHVGDINEISSA